MRPDHCGSRTASASGHARPPSLRIAAGVLLSLWCAGVGAADRFDPVRSLIERELVQHSVPSISVALAKDGRILWEEGFGWADRERRIQATAHTTYSVASISKPLTATGLMTLVEAGKVDLDAPVNDYLGAAKLRSRVDPHREATPRQLLNHTSGLNTHFEPVFSDAGHPLPSKDQTIARYGNLVYLPGEKTTYSNIGYGIVGDVVERVSGMDFADYMRTAVFAPLGMEHSSVGPPPGLEASTAVRYDRSSELPLPPYASTHEGAGGIHACAHDLLRFALFHMGLSGRQHAHVLSAQGRERMQQAEGLDRAPHAYGLGWLITQRPGGPRVVHHSGGMGGVTTHLFMVPAEGIALVVLSNRQSVDIDSIAEAALKVLLPEWQDGYFNRSSPPAARAVAPARKFPDSFLGVWRGAVHTYEGEIPLTAWFLASGEAHVQLQSQPKALLNEPGWSSNGVFSGDAVGDLGTDDLSRGGNRYTLSYDLKQRDDRLTGVATAFTVGGDRDPRRRMLGHWVELRRDGASPAGSSGN